MQREESSQKLSCRGNNYKDSIKTKTYTKNPQSDNECSLKSTSNVSQIVLIKSYVAVKCHIHVRANAIGDFLNVQDGPWFTNEPLVRGDPSKISFNIEKNSRKAEALEATVEIEVFYSENKLEFTGLENEQEINDKIGESAIRCGDLMVRFHLNEAVNI